MANSAFQQPPNHSEFCGALLNLQGAIHLAGQALNDHMDGNQRLVAAEGVLQLAQAEVERLYAIMNLSAVENAWPSGAHEVAANDETARVPP